MLSGAAVLVIAAAAVLPAATEPFLPAGDHCEYVQMTESLANHGTPDPRPEDARPDLRNCAELSRLFDVRDADLPPQIGPYVRARNGHYYSWHFWGYSLFVVPAKLGLRALGADEGRAFSLTNGALFLGALAGAALFSPLPPYRRIALAALLSASPALWFVRWAHPEVFCAALTTMALVLADGRRWVWTALVVAIASWQAPPLVVLLAWCVGRAASDGWRSPILAGLSGGAVALVPVAFSLAAFGAPSILAAHNSRVALVSPRRVLELFFDPNIGMGMYAPVAVTLTVAVALWALLVRRTCPPAAQLLAVLVAMMTLASTTMNWNHGTDGPSRYVVWMLPLVFYSVVSMRLPPGGGWRRAYGLMLVASVLTQAGILVALGGHAPRFTYVEHSPLARLLLRRVPALYNPSPEIFFERTRHREEPSPFGVFFDRDRCRKALVAVRDLDLLEAICAGVPDPVKHRRDATPLDALIYVDFPKRMPVVSAAARHAAMNPSSLAAWLALVKDRCTTPHEPPCDIVRLHVTARRVQPGDRLRADVSLGSVAIVGGAELHLGGVLPNSKHFVRGPDGVLRASGARHGLIRAERTSVVGDAGYSATVFDVEIGPEFAAGEYEVFAILVRATPLRESELGVDLRDVVAWALETVVVTGRPDDRGRNFRTDAASVPEVRAGVDGTVLDQDLVVEVRARGPARIAGQAELRAAPDLLTLRDGDLRQVTVDRAQVFAVVDGHAEPVLGVRSRERHRPRRGGLHRCATLGPDVDATVELAALRPGRPAPTELGVDGAAYRPARRQ